MYVALDPVTTRAVICSSTTNSGGTLILAASLMNIAGAVCSIGSGGGVVGGVDGVMLRLTPKSL